MKTHIGRRPPNDGGEWECQCARCGSSVEFDSCNRCGGDGWTAIGELYEEDPLWYDVDDIRPCYDCGGECGWYFCISSTEYCEAHPLPGREQTPRGTIEWFKLEGKE